jgi:rRNA maturation endonuclease Nob1
MDVPRASPVGSILEKYGMIFCPHCHGRGKVFKDAKEFNVCIACGGFGAIKASGEEPIDRNSYKGRYLG